ncbi:MAG: desulfoferrodoxin [Nitrospirae bacterium]|nr:desulfoferrodoxin [Nitrospirota bacterium]
MKTLGQMMGAGWMLAAAMAVLAFPVQTAQAAMEPMRGDDPKHTPVITAPETVKPGEPFQVTIAVGKTMHPSQTDHMIQWIELFADNVPLAHVTLSPVVTQPVVTVTVSLQQSATLRALAQPNHSAPWEGTKPITVTPPAPSKP